MNVKEVTKPIRIDKLLFSKESKSEIVTPLSTKYFL